MKTYFVLMGNSYCIITSIGGGGGGGVQHAAQHL